MFAFCCFSDVAVLMAKNWKRKERERERERERLKTVEKANYFHVLGKCFLAAGKSSIYNRVQVLREVIGGSRVKPLAGAVES